MIGLFGTVQNSNWRDPFTARYTQEGIPFFNPQKKGWTPDDATIESQHMMVDDRIVLFAITAETVGFTPLAEVGFALASVLQSPAERHLLVYIAPDVEQAFYQAHEPSAKGSMKCRRLVLSHLNKAAELYPHRVYRAMSLADLLETSILRAKSMDPH